MVKNTPATHPDYANLNTALEKIRTIADSINEKKKKAEMLQKVSDLQASFDEEIVRCRTALAALSPQVLVQPHRVWIAEGTFTHYPTRKGDSGEALQYILFNDILILATVGKKDKLKLRDNIELVNIEIKDVMDTQCTLQTACTQ